MISQHTYISKPSVDEAKDVSRAIRGVLRLQRRAVDDATAKTASSPGAISVRRVLPYVIAGAVALGLAISAASAHAAAQMRSVDCRRARLPTEVTICRDPGLRALDRAVVRTFAAEFSGPNEKPNLYQRDWTRRRNACGTDVECIRKAYRKRLWDFDHETDAD